MCHKMMHDAMNMEHGMPCPQNTSFQKCMEEETVKAQPLLVNRAVYPAQCTCMMQIIYSMSSNTSNCMPAFQALLPSPRALEPQRKKKKDLRNENMPRS